MIIRANSFMIFYQLEEYSDYILLHIVLAL